MIIDLTLWAALTVPNFLKPFLFFTSYSFQTWLLILVSACYGAVFYLRVRHPEKYSTSIAWLPPFLQLGVWSYIMTTSTQPPEISAGWGILTLLFVLCPLLFDQKEQLPEWLNTSLLFATLSSVLWAFLLTSTAATSSPSITGVLVKQSQWMQVGLLLCTFVGVGFLLAASMLAWQMQYNSNAQHPSIGQSFHRIQRLATLAFLTSLLVLLFTNWRNTPFSWGNIVLGLLAMISTLLPTLQPTQETSNPLAFSSVHGLLTKASGILAVLWLFFYLVITA